jgi:hypothetical protein
MGQAKYVSMLWTAAASQAPSDGCNRVEARRFGSIEIGSEFLLGVFVASFTQPIAVFCQSRFDCLRIDAELPAERGQ